MSLEVKAQAKIDDFALDVEFTASAGETVAVLGPNGAGKTTLLSVIAGLRALDGGRIALDGTTLDDPDRDVWVPAEHRSVGVAFQDGLLFPHLDLADNVAFGLRCHGRSRREARRMALTWLDRVELADRSTARPQALSGGQAQRVALARALASSPDVLLLDEPLSALDVDARDRFRARLHDWLAQTAVRLIVTHDPLEAMSMADRLVILEQGRVVQDGTPADINRAPRTPFVGRLVGLNLLDGAADGHQVVLASGAVLVTPESHTGPVTVAFSPHAVLVHRERPTGSARNTWATTVAGLHDEHDRVRVELADPIGCVAEVTPAAVQELALRPGDTVWASVKATELDVHSRA